MLEVIKWVDVGERLVTGGEVMYRQDLGYRGHPESKRSETN